MLGPFGQKRQTFMDQRYINRIQLIKDVVNLNLSEQKLEILAKAAERTIDLMQSGGLILTCGNGGSHSTAEHLSAELNWRLDEERVLGIPCVCLGSNQSMFSGVVNESSKINDRFIRTAIPFSRIDIPKVLITFTTSVYSRAIIKINRFATSYPNMADSIILFAGEDKNNTIRSIFGPTEYILTVDNPNQEKLSVDIIQEVHLILMHTYSDMLFNEIEKIKNGKQERIFKS